MAISEGITQSFRLVRTKCKEAFMKEALSVPLKMCLETKQVHIFIIPVKRDVKGIEGFVETVA